jgi:hypothetical protein
LENNGLSGCMAVFKEVVVLCCFQLKISLFFKRGFQTPKRPVLKGVRRNCLVVLQFWIKFEKILRLE